MSESDDSGADAAREQERLIRTQCRACGRTVNYKGTGRWPEYCSPACRQKGWALRQAAEQLGRDDPRPAVVREVVARERVQQIRVAGRAPRATEDWALHLETLIRQLNNGEHRDTWRHRRLAYTLAQAMVALERTNPGRIDWSGLPAQPVDTDTHQDPRAQPVEAPVPYLSPPPQRAPGLSRQQRRARERQQKKR